MPKLSVRCAVVLAAALLAAGPAAAGTISIAWDPVSSTDLAGYRVYWGPSSGNYPNSLDVGMATSATINGLADCTTWYVAVKAYDGAGNVSGSYSNEVSGWPRPTVAQAVPSAAETGSTLSVTVSGTNFQSGASLTVSDPAVAVNSVTVQSCSQLVANLTLGGGATAGPVDFEVVNPDTVFGTGPGVFTVQAAVAPTVSSTNPAAGASGVGLTVDPTVTFSEAMAAPSISASTVQLLDSGGSVVAQAAGSPSLSGNGTTATIVPASDLIAGATYRIRVVGGAGGVLDLAGHPMASTYTQSPGFTTVPDAAGPAISGVTAQSVGSTTATVVWTTDEPADSQVFYRRAGTTEYQQTDVASSLVTSHSVLVQGLDPSTSWEYHVRSADGAGNATASSPDQTLTTSANAFSYLRVETELGSRVSPVRSSSDAAAFGESCIDTPAGTPTGTPTSPAGTATFGVNVPQAGTWHLWVRVYAPNASSDSWFERIDGAAREAIHAGATGRWVWIAGRSYSLSAGLHAIELAGFDARAKADRLLLTDDASFVPTEQPTDDQTPPAAPSGFAGAPGNAQIALTWTNPADGDFVRTVVRYRTDGAYPTSPDDGFAVTSQSGPPGAGASFDHVGLTNGTAYSYSAFAVDASGNASVAAQTTASPADLEPPDPVQNLRRSDTR